MKETDRTALQVRMLGGLSVSWEGVPLIDGRQSGSQFCLLLEAVLYHHKKGVDRATLKDMLFEERDVDDVQHAIRNVIYNARKRLKSAGLPDVSYIDVRKGIYYWTDEVPVDLDTDKLEDLYEEASRTEDHDRRLELLMEACSVYRGGFLEQLSSAPWVVAEAHRLRVIFQSAVNDAAALLREKKEYKILKELGRMAVAADPFAEWEVLIVEALAAMGKYKEAETFCEETIDRYIWEHGAPSADYVRSVSNRLSMYLIHQHRDLDEIQEKLIEKRTDVRGGFLCSYPAFQEVYRILSRTMDRQQDKLFILLCTLVDGKGNPLRESGRLDELSERLCDSVVRSVRHSDTVARYGKGQYLVLLVNISIENCDVVQKRITQNFLMGRQRTGIEYSVRSVIISENDLSL